MILADVIFNNLGMIYLLC